MIAVDILEHAHEAGRMEVICTKCTRSRVVFAINMQVACEMLNDSGWILEGGERLVCPKCPAVRSKRLSGDSLKDGEKSD